MRRVLRLLATLVIVSALLSPAAVRPSATEGAQLQATVTVVVPATAQWVSTGLTVNTGDQLAITATGLWTPGGDFGIVGPDGSSRLWGDNFLNLTDIGKCPGPQCGTTPTAHFAALIAYIGNNPPPPASYFSGSADILTEAKKVFLVGSNYNATAGLAGTLWLNINDDAYSGFTVDNAGQVTAQVTVTPGAVDLRIEIKPIQAVEGVDINGDKRLDLVLGRPMVVRVKITIEPPGALPEDQVITTELFFQGALLTDSRTVQALAANNFFVDFFRTPGDFGDSTISVRVATENATKEANLIVTVKPVRDIRYVYFQLNYLGATPNFARTVTNSADFLQAVYPVSPSRFTNDPMPNPLQPSAASFQRNIQGAAADAKLLWRATQRAKAERGIAIVPQEWFTYHQLGDIAGKTIIIKQGVIFPMAIGGAFVLDDRPFVTAHELGHTYGFLEGYVLRDDGSCCHSYGSPTSGYWVQRRQEVNSDTTGIQVIDYMGAFRSDLPYPDPGQKPAVPAWSPPARFADLFSQFRTQSNDPEVLLVTGTIDRSGAATIEDMDRLPDGTVSQPPAGDGAVRVLDAKGNVVAEVPFAVDFRVLTDPPITTDSAPFAFAVPYPATASQVQIVRAGQVLAQVSATTKLLHTAVASIPAAGFVRTPEQLRQALQLKIDAFDAQLAVGDLTGARNNLKNDIRQQLVNWLVDSYPTQSPLEYTKTEILGLVDELVQRLGV